MPIHEQSLNQEIAKVLDQMRRQWSVSGEETGVLRGGGRPDIVVRQNERPVVLIENEFMPATSVEAEAKGRLGAEMENGDKVRAVIALRSPTKLREVASNQLMSKIAAAEFDYALFSGNSADSSVRFPKSGWLTGGAVDLAGLVYRSAVPVEIADDLAVSIKNGVNGAAGLAQKLPSDTGKKIEKILQQQYGEQTLRMAMVIMLNALIFQELFAGRDGVRNIGETREGGLRKQPFLNEWQKILEINYWPIFGVARKILIAIPEAKAQFILDRLIKSAEQLAQHAFSFPDIFGVVFQKLIADRKFLATFYTRPASATLLANLAIPQDMPFKDGSWEENAGDYVIADFACGTGALLSASYRRIAELYEHKGGDMAQLHSRMMEHAMIGCDVMPSAVHLTASVLASMHPGYPFEKTKMYAMPYGEPKKGQYRIGSLELIDSNAFLPVISVSAEKAGGHGAVKAEYKEILWDYAHLVIMNPPFTRPTNHEGAHKDIPNPAFAAFGADEKLQAKLGERSKQLRKETCGTGNAGLASDFVALADKMAQHNGTTAFVLPLTVMAGESWKEVRMLWAKHYADIRVISLAAVSAEESAWSADTSMAEILFIGRKVNGRKVNGRKANGQNAVYIPQEKRRGKFIVLNKRPDNEMEAMEIARVINKALCGKIKRLEDGPIGATPLVIGKDEIGGVIDAPLPKETDKETVWATVRIRDFSLAQIAYALTNGLLWLPHWTRKQAIELPVSELQNMAKRGFISRDINGKDGAKFRGPFDILPLSESEPVPTYPSLWNADAKRETNMIVAPDRRGVIRPGMAARAAVIWKTAGRVHHNVDFGFGSRPLAVATTEEPTIGGRAWLGVYGFKNRGQEAAYALWSNSTLGLLLYWWYSNKPQGNRGTISPARLLTMPVLDLRTLSSTQLASARRGFDSIKKKELLPFYLADKDPTRESLDKIILVDVLGLPAKVLKGVADMRAKLCQEPSVRGGKK